MSQSYVPNRHVLGHQSVRQPSFFRQVFIVRSNCWKHAFSFVAMLGFAFFALGCAPRLTVLRSEVRTSGVVRIELQSINRGKFVFMVWNETALPLVIDRSKVVLGSPRSRRLWTRGMYQRNLVTVKPGLVHDVKIEFDLSDTKQGEEVQVDFAPAVFHLGQPVAIEPLTFRVLD